MGEWRGPPRTLQKRGARALLADCPDCHRVGFHDKSCPRRPPSRKRHRINNTPPSTTEANQ